MRDQDKPFVLHRRGPWNFTIIPRRISGWAQFCVWMALLVPLLLWFEGYNAAHRKDSGLYTGLAVFIAGMTAWTVGGIWWMKARAEIVDVAEILRQKREIEGKPASKR